MGGPLGAGQGGGSSSGVGRFFPSPKTKCVLLFPLGVFSLNFGGVFEAPGCSNVHV